MGLGRNDLIALIQKGMVAHQAGSLSQAEAHYKSALAIDPDQFDALHFLGLLEAQRGNLAEADRLVSRSLAVNAQRAEAHTNHARILRQLKRPGEAVARCDRALALNPYLVDALILRGNALRDLGRLVEALASVEQSLKVNADEPLAHYNRGLVLLALGREQEALASQDKALELRPNDPDFLIGRGLALAALLRQSEAAQCYERALAVRPGDIEALIGRGDALHLMGSWQAALDSYERALTLEPRNARIRLALCMGQLPVIHDAEAEVEERREAYARQLETLSTDAEHGRLDGFAEAAGRYLPFYLAYQGRSDRDLQARYGALMCGAMAAHFPPVPLAGPPAPSEPVRIGIVTGYFCQHSVWKIPVAGWVTAFDRRRFQVFGYYTGGRTDAVTATAVKLCDRFVQGPTSIAEWREVIAADAPHVLLYPELNMDPSSAALAAMRLAPVQCNTLGHPETSGYPTIDYFLSSELMEPADGDEHYTERLIRLPNLSLWYEPIEAPPAAMSRPQLGLRPDAIVFWCGQSLFKYLPRDDEVFPRIAQGVRNCQFVFIEHPQSTAATAPFRRRLERAFAAHGLTAADHCVILPRLQQHEFVGAIGQCDIVLDSIGWSGFNSTIEGLPNDLPIVTMAGPLMRGRHSTAVLTMMDVTETVTGTIDEYVAVAQRLATDRAWRTAVSERIKANKHRLYRDRAPIAALEEFLIRVTRDRRDG